jgi:hypothetical protein
MPSHANESIDFNPSLRSARPYGLPCEPRTRLLALVVSQLVWLAILLLVPGTTLMAQDSGAPTFEIMIRQAYDKLQAYSAGSDAPAAIVVSDVLVVDSHTIWDEPAWTTLSFDQPSGVYYYAERAHDPVLGVERATYHLTWMDLSWNDDTRNLLAVMTVRDVWESDTPGLLTGEPAVSEDFELTAHYRVSITLLDQSVSYTSTAMFDRDRGEIQFADPVIRNLRAVLWDDALPAGQNEQQAVSDARREPEPIPATGIPFCPSKFDPLLRESPGLVGTKEHVDEFSHTLTARGEINCVCESLNCVAKCDYGIEPYTVSDESAPLGVVATSLFPRINKFHVTSRKHFGPKSQTKGGEDAADCAFGAVAAVQSCFILCDFQVGIAGGPLSIGYTFTETPLEGVALGQGSASDFQSAKGLLTKCRCDKPLFRIGDGVCQRDKGETSTTPSPDCKPDRFLLKGDCRSTKFQACDAIVETDTRYHRAFATCLEARVKTPPCVVRAANPRQECVAVAGAQSGDSADTADASGTTAAPKCDIIEEGEPGFETAPFPDEASCLEEAKKLPPPESCPVANDCGNGKLDDGETPTTCCQDAGCGRDGFECLESEISGKFQCECTDIEIVPECGSYVACGERKQADECAEGRRCVSGVCEAAEMKPSCCDTDGNGFVDRQTCIQCCGGVIGQDPGEKKVCRVQSTGPSTGGSITETTTYELEPACGDEFCEADESCSSCAADCGACATPVCGNGICDANETCSSCSADCGACPDAGGSSGGSTGGGSTGGFPTCRDGVCDFVMGESCSTCTADCGRCNPPCGDLICEKGEKTSACPGDCSEGDGPVCGDGNCAASYPNGDTPQNCPQDCGSGPAPSQCGNGTCDADESNSGLPAYCPGDCDTCGNGFCGPSENQSTCARDCDVCGDGSCGTSENTTTCSADCRFPRCGNAACEAGENSNNCDADCNPVCGNRACESGELASCAGDCPVVCGDTKCESGRGETCSSCSQDCGTCPVVCGDRTCDTARGESCSSCSSDCGACAVCGNEVCEAGEDSFGCIEDCQIPGGYCGDGTCAGPETYRSGAAGYCPSDCPNPFQGGFF